MLSQFFDGQRSFDLGFPDFRLADPSRTDQKSVNGADLTEPSGWEILLIRTTTLMREGIEFCLPQQMIFLVRYFSRVLMGG